MSPGDCAKGFRARLIDDLQAQATKGISTRRFDGLLVGLLCVAVPLLLVAALVATGTGVIGLPAGSAAARAAPVVATALLSGYLVVALAPRDGLVEAVTSIPYPRDPVYALHTLAPVQRQCFDQRMSNDAQTIIREESSRFAAALASTDPGRQVPTCPEWTASDLLWHLTEVHEFWAAVLASGAMTDDQAEPLEAQIAPRPDDLDQLAERRTAATEALLTQLEQRSDDEAAWFWFAADRTVGVIRRMQTHEATIHRVDAELTARMPVTAIDSEVALAGLKHMIAVMWPAQVGWIPEWASITPVATADIAVDDEEPAAVLISRWRGTRPRDGKTFDVPVAQPLTRGDTASVLAPRGSHADTGPTGRANGISDLPVAEVSGTAQALNLWAWGRGAAVEQAPGAGSPLRITGDQIAVAELSALIDEGID